MMWLAAVTKNPVIALFPALFIGLVVLMVVCAAIFEE